MLDHIPWNLFLKLLHETGSFRPWPNQGHLPYQNVKKLGQLVQAGFPQEFSHLGHTGIILDRPGFPFRRFLLYLHGSELVHHKGLAVQSHTLLLKQHRAGAGRLDGNGLRQHNGGCNQNPKGRADNIHSSFCQPVQGIGKRYIADVDHRKSHQILCIGMARHQRIVIRNKLRMHAGFLTDIHHTFQIIII